jgi:hypothetical protein
MSRPISNPRECNSMRTKQQGSEASCEGASEWKLRARNEFCAMRSWYLQRVLDRFACGHYSSATPQLGYRAFIRFASRISNVFEKGGILWPLETPG